MISPITFGSYSAPSSPILNPSRFGRTAPVAFGSSAASAAIASEVRFGRHQKPTSLAPVEHYLTEALAGTKLNVSI